MEMVAMNKNAIETNVEINVQSIKIVLSNICCCGNKLDSVDVACINQLLDTIVLPELGAFYTAAVETNIHSIKTLLSDIARNGEKLDSIELECINELLYAIVLACE